MYGLSFISGFDVNAQDSLGRMPLHIACQQGMRDNVVALLNYSQGAGDDSAGIIHLCTFYLFV
jgi:ankyrin repeat protein